MTGTLMIELELVTILYVCAIGLLAIGAVGLVAANNLFRMVLALVLAEAGVNLLLILAGYRGDATAPILGFGPGAAVMVDPIPQALVLTAIVIGVGVQALAVSVLVRVYRSYRTLDVRELKRRLELGIAAENGIDAPGSSEEPEGGRPLSPVPPRPRTQEASP
jgi:multisubunit Na+/H+ antiporter MnhC subunit